MVEEKKSRRLSIKAFHVDEVVFGKHADLTTGGKLTVGENAVEKLLAEATYIKDIKIQIIYPGERDRWTNTIMDVIPISAKVLGVIGEGITHTVTGAYIILTGVDEVGKQTHEFGSSEGNLKDQMIYGRAGTPGEDDIMISFDVTFKAGMGQERCGTTEAHALCDAFINEYRKILKTFNGNQATEKHVYYDIMRPGKKKVVIIKQVAGQGAMYDTHLFADEPSGVEGGKSIIDMGNMPIVLTPNEYRDGIIRSMQ